MTQQHIRMLLQQIHINAADLDILAMQLNAALDVPVLLYTAPQDSEHREETFEDRLVRGWEDLLHRLSR